MNNSAGFQALIRCFEKTSSLSEDSLTEGIRILSSNYPSYPIRRHSEITTAHCYDCGQRVFTDVHICDECAKDDIPF